MVACMGTWAGNKKTEYHRNRRISVVEWLKSLRTYCKDCGETNSIVLDFHHRNANEKSFSLTGSFCYSRSRDAILKEIKKCDVLCANCHRIREHEIRLRKAS